MKAYTINLIGLGQCTFDRLEVALDEIRMHMEEMDEDMQVLITTQEMTEEEYLNLPEFQGY